MEDYQLLIDLHKRAKRQGPGGDAETRKAIDLAMIDPSTPLKIADIGCGTGSSTMLLARLLTGQSSILAHFQLSKSLYNKCLRRLRLIMRKVSQNGTLLSEKKYSVWITL